MRSKVRFYNPIIIRLVYCCLILSVRLTAIATEPYELWSKTGPLPEDSKLLSVAGADGTYVIGGENGCILLSSNLTDWAASQTVVTGKVARVVYSGEKFAALSSLRSVYISSDGSGWTETLKFANGGAWIKDLAYGNGTFCVLTSTNSTLTSQDGQTWTLHPGEYSYPGSILTFVNGVFATYTPVDNKISTAVSTDGATWNVVTNTAVGDSQLLYLGDRYFAVSGTAVKTSSTLEQDVVWTTVISDNTAAFLGATYGNGKYVVASSRSSSIYVSEDGVSWTTVDSLQEGVEFFQPSGLGVCDGVFVLLGENGAIYTSSDGMDWTLRSKRGVGTIYNADHRCVDYFADRFIAFNTVGQLYSKDGVNWEKLPRDPIGQPCYAAGHSDDKIMVVGYTGSNRTYTNILTHTYSSGISAGGSDLNAVTYGGGLYLAAGKYGKLYTSPDAVNWTLQSTGISTTINAITYGGGLYMAVGESSVVLVSTNGVDWEKRTASSSSQSLRSVAYGNGYYVILAYGGLYYSQNAINWTSRSAPLGIFYSVIYAKNRFFLAMIDSVYTMASGNSSYQLLYQADEQLTGIIYGRDRLVAVGLNGGTYACEAFDVFAPKLTPQLMPETDQLVLSVEAEPQRAFEVQYSEDLVNWSFQSSHTNGSVSLETTNSFSASVPKGFYRVVYP